MADPRCSNASGVFLLFGWRVVPSFEHTRKFGHNVVGVAMLKVVKINAQSFVKFTNRNFAPPNHAGYFQKNFVAIFQIIPLYRFRASLLVAPP